MTQHPSADTDSLDALEVRVAHQDAVIEELNEALNQQWKLIDALTREIESLRERASAIEADTGRGPADAERRRWTFPLRRRGLHV